MNRKIRTICAYLFLIAVALFVLLPIVYMLDASLKTNEEIFRIPFTWRIGSLQFDNYRSALSESPVFVYLKNSAIVASVATAANVLVSSVAGYGMAKLVAKRSGFMNMVLLVLLMLPAQALIFPLFMMMASMNLADTLKALIIPGITSPFSVFFMKQYFLTFPDEMLEAARVEGAEESVIFWKIVLPYARPALSALAVFNFLFNWNNFLWPLIILKSKSNFTIPIGIAQMSGEYQTPYGTLMAAATLVSLPVLLIYFVLQKKLIRGATLKVNKSVDR